MLTRDARFRRLIAAFAPIGQEDPRRAREVMRDVRDGGAAKQLVCSSSTRPLPVLTRRPSCDSTRSSRRNGAVGGPA